MAKFLGLSLLLFSFVMLINGLAYAQRTCTRTVDTSDGTKNITIDCSASFTKDKNPDIIRNPHVLDEKVDNFFDSTEDKIQQSEDSAGQRADIQSKQEAAIDAVRDKQNKLKSNF